MATQQAPRIGDILLERQWVKPEDLARAARTQKLTHAPLGEILLQQTSINKRQLARALRWQRFVRMALVVGTCTASLAQPAFASDAQRLTEDMMNSVNNVATTSVKKNRRSTDRITPNALKQTLGTPMWTVLAGEYAAGVDRYTEGLSYKAKWSEDDVKIEVRYQF